MTPEVLEKNRIHFYLKLLGAYVFRPVQLGMGVATVDFLVCLDGKFYAIEVKVRPKKLTARQQIVLSQVVKAGGYAIVAYSVDDVKAAFSAFNSSSTQEYYA